MSFFSRTSRASFAEAAFDQVLAQSTEHDLIAEQLGRLIIYHENVDFLVRAHDLHVLSTQVSVATRLPRPAAIDEATCAATRAVARY